MKIKARLPKISASLELPMAILGFVYLGIYTLQVATTLDANSANYLEFAAWIIWSFFALDLIVKFVINDSFVSFLRANWLEIIALVVPFMRVLRVLRIFVAIRAITPLIKSRVAATGIYMALLLPISWFVGGVAVLDAEQGLDGAKIQNLPDALWWSLATLTTVGYGDFYPITTEGKAVAAVLMLLGIGLFSACAGILASWLTQEKKIEAK
jgi:voltage-gated potassium channel